MHPSEPAGAADPKRPSVRALRAVNFFIADVQNGMGPYLALFLQASAGWNPAQIGSALAAGNLAQVLAQTPAGAVIDNLRAKRGLLLAGIGLIMTAMVATAVWTVRPVVLGGQVLVGVAGAIFPPCLAAIALGLVGRQRFDQAQGTNQAYNAAGNLTAALALGAVGYYLHLRWMFFLVALLGLGAALCISRIRPEDIDFNAARGADQEGGTDAGPAPAGVAEGLRALLGCFRDLLRQPPVRVFLVSAVLFHFANAAMVPLVTQLLARGQGPRQAVLYTSGYMVASQLIFMVVAAASGRLAGRLGRKPLFMFAFAALAARGVLYTLSHHPAALIAVQCMDGLGAGVFGVVGILIIADLTKGTGRFNAAQGAVATAQGLGAFLSNEVAGYLANARGDNFTFLVLAGIAGAGLLFFGALMPETKDAARSPAASGGPG